MTPRALAMERLFQKHLEDESLDDAERVAQEGLSSAGSMFEQECWRQRVAVVAVLISQKGGV